MRKIKINLRNWMLKHAGSRHAKSWLSFFSFAESSFFPIPPDFLLVAILGSKQEHRWFRYSSLTAIWSVVGGAFGYAIGLLLFDSVGQFLINTYDLGQYITTVQELFKQNAFWAIFIASFTPIPYKIFTLSAGFFGINFFIFIIASILGRFLRFFAVGYIMKVFGEDMRRFAFKYFNILTLLFAIGAGVFIVTMNLF